MNVSLAYRLRVVLAVSSAATAFAAQAAPPVPVPVTVTNAPGVVVTGTAVVRDGDNPARSPVRLRSEPPQAAINVVVPAGVVWVLERYAGRCDVDATGTLTGITLRVRNTTTGTDDEDYAEAHYLDYNGANTNAWAGSAVTRMYAQAGENVQVTASSNFNATGAVVRNCRFSVTGYSVKLP